MGGADKDAGEAMALEVQGLGDDPAPATAVTPVVKDGDKGKGKEKEKEPAVNFFKLFHQADSIDITLMFIGTVGACANGAAFPMFAIIFGFFTDTFGNASVTPDFMQQVSNIALYFVYIAIGSFVVSYFQAAFWMLAGGRQTSKLRNAYLAAVLRQDVPYFDTQATTGGLLKGLGEDSSAVQEAISDKMGHFLQHASCFLIGYIVAFVKGWDMTLVMVGALPFLGGCGAVLSKLSSVTAARSEAAYVEASSQAQQSLSQIRTVAAYRAEEKSIKQFQDALMLPLKAGIKQGFVSGVANGGILAVMYWTYALGFIYGAWRISTGHYTGGQVLTVLIAALVGGFSAGQAAPVIATFAKGQVAARKLYDVIERKPLIDVDSSSGKVLEVVKGELELRNVQFTYPARLEHPVFQNFSLLIPAGKTVALVGSSGSGKSTAVQLIERFYDPQAGVVLLDGIELPLLNLNWLRKQIGLVSQEPTLFATTIYENIAMGLEGATEEQVKAAAQAANAHRFIGNLPQQYKTQVGERGLSLSGGQKQRIAIARAILKNPRIMLLDEATSALDTESERIVQDALNRMIVGRTTLVVAHRLSTIKDADIIAVVSSGAVVEQGSHADLIANDTGHYTTLVKMQMKEEMEKKREKEAKAGADGEAAPDPDAVQIVPMETAGSLGKAGSLGPAGSLKTSLDLEKAASAGLRKGSAGPADAELGIAAEKAKDTKNKEVNVGFSRLIAYNKPEWHYFIIGIVGAAMVGVVMPAFSFLVSEMITIFYSKAADEVVSAASFLCWMFFVIGIGVIVGATLQHGSFGVVGQWLGYRLRSALFRNIIYQEIGWFDMSENASSSLSTRLSTDAGQIRGAVGDTLAMVVQNLFCLAFGLAIAFAYDWRMALLVVGVLPFMASGSIIYYRTVSGGMSGSTKIFDNANQAVSDAFSNIRIIHAFTLRSQVCDLYSRLAADAINAMRKQSHLTGLTLSYSQFCIFSVYGLIIWFGGLELDSGRATFEQMLMGFFSIIMACMGLAQASTAFPDVAKSKGAIKNVFPIMDRKSLIDASSAEGIIPAELRGEVELKDVTFVYPSRPTVTVFSGFSLRIPAGKNCALVGESGSGKSTIVNLIERFYDVEQGIVLLDGMDIKKYNLSWLRQQIGLVSQEPLLFAISILDNIKYGKPDATMAEVEAAARAANAYDFIMSLPEGFNTQVGERGMQLSGGQKQRVAIARTVIKNPRIMLLDEATSALDARAEREVQEALDQIMAKQDSCTSVVVAHRLSTIRNADMIALVFRGSVLEKGTHDELMAIPDGGYKRLVAAQMGGAAAARPTA